MMYKIMSLMLLIGLNNAAIAQPPDVLLKDFKLQSKLPSTSVKDQYMSSTCWSFASNSFIESELLKKGINVDLSEMFVARYSYINKLKQHLATKGKTFFTPGGQFHDVLKVIREYGLVPESEYTGRARSEFHDHAELDTIMKYMVARMVTKGQTSLTEADLDSLNNILDFYLGIVPTEFRYAGKNYSAKSFCKDYLKFNPDNYIEITSYNHHPFYKSFVLESPYNWTFDKYYNVPLIDFVSITDYALRNGYSVCWDGDVSEKTFQFESSLAYLPAEKNYQTARQVSFENKSTTIDHMMHIVGSGKDKSGKNWYYVKNSWGNSGNAAQGFMYMQDSYFKIKTVAIIVNKYALPSDIRTRMGL